MHNLCDSQLVLFSISVFLNLCDSQLVFFSICAILNLCNSQLVFFSIKAVWGRHRQLDDSLVGQLTSSQAEPAPRIEPVFLILSLRFFLLLVSCSVSLSYKRQLFCVDIIQATMFIGILFFCYSFGLGRSRNAVHSYVIYMCTFMRAAFWYI